MINITKQNGKVYMVHLTGPASPCVDLGFPGSRQPRRQVQWDLMAICGFVPVLRAGLNDSHSLHLNHLATPLKPGRIG